jgi:hypothetical protein
MEKHDCVKRASECLQMAQQAKNLSDRTTLLDIASKWALLAGDSFETQAVLDLIEAMRQSPENYGVSS